MHLSTTAFITALSMLIATGAATTREETIGVTLYEKVNFLGIKEDVLDDGLCHQPKLLFRKASSIKFHSHSDCRVYRDTNCRYNPRPLPKEVPDLDPFSYDNAIGSVRCKFRVTDVEEWMVATGTP